MVFLIHTELRCTVNRTSDLAYLTLKRIMHSLRKLHLIKLKRKLKWGWTHTHTHTHAHSHKHTQMGTWKSVVFVLQVCENDILVVDIVNRVPGQGFGIHWRGQPQKETPMMDGVPMVTQCPISSSTTFQYKFRASRAGTHMWHAHTGTWTDCNGRKRSSAIWRKVFIVSKWLLFFEAIRIDIYTNVAFVTYRTHFLAIATTKIWQAVVTITLIVSLRKKGNTAVTINRKVYMSSL